MTLHVILLHVQLQYVNFIGMGMGQILTFRNDPICNFALRAVTIYKLHWYGPGGVKF